MTNSPLSLPQGWVKTNIDDLVKVILGQSPPSPTYNDHGEGLPFFQGKLEFGELHPTVQKWCSHPNKIATAGDVLLSIRAPVGATNIATEKCCIGRGLAALHPVAGVSTLFILYIIRAFESKIAEQSTGSTFDAITGDRLRKIELPLPPLPEQHRIIAKIEELFTQLDAGVASLKKVQAQLRRYRQAVLKAAFEGRLTQEWREEHRGEIEPADVMRQRIVLSQQKWNIRKSKNLDNSEPEKFFEVPEEWIMTRIHNIAPIIQYGSSERADDNMTGIPIIRMGNLQDGKIDFSNLKFISRKSPDIAKCQLHRGDVLFNRTNSAELVGKTAVYNKEFYEAVFASYLIRVRVDDEMFSPEFLSYYINSAFGRSYISSVVSQQVGQANVNGTKLANMPIPYPHVSEQKMIVAEIERHFSQIDHLENTIETGLRQAESLRQSILKRAFEGKLVPHDPNDEPASVLLERIKAEKEKTSPVTKKRKSVKSAKKRGTS